MSDARNGPPPSVPDRLYIDGAWVEPRDQRTFASIDPYTGKVWTMLPEAGVEDVADAVTAANRAGESGWFSSPGRERRRALLGIAEVIASRAKELALIESLDNGKLLREMDGQLAALPDWYEFYAGLADKVRGASIPIDKPGMFGYTLRQPVGVCAAITAWNSPLLLLTWKLAPALAAGCTMVVKPSEHASASTLAFGEVLEEAGLPSGVVNIVLGGPQTGSSLVGHPGVDKVAFTGSATIGARVGAAGISDVKRVTLELGGKSPNIVFDDAPYEAALAGAVAGIFAATGQTCAAGSRLLVHRSIHDQFVEDLVERAANIKLGDPLATDTEMGPLAFNEHRASVGRHVEVAVSEGATLTAGGAAPSTPHLADGYFFEPTILTDVNGDMCIARDEVFGPVVAVLPFDDEHEAITIANASEYGLAAGVWTSNLGRAHRVAHALNAGTVWINAYRTVSYEAPYGGWGKSGIGRENGVEAMDAYLEDKAIWVNHAEGDGRDPFKLG